MDSRIVVKGLNWIGDAVMSSPFFESLKKSDPEIKITVISRPWVAEVYKNNNYIDTVIEIDDKKNKIGLIKYLREQKFENGILLPKSLSSAIIFKLGNVKKISGWATQYRKFFLSNPVKLTEKIKSQHQVFLHLELAYANFGKKIDTPKIFLNTIEEIDSAVKKKWFIFNNKKYLGINPGAAFGPAKRWLPEYFAEVINYFCLKNTNIIPVLFGSKNEVSIGDNILRSVDRKINLINLIGKTSLQELFSSIKLCSFFLTNDSGPMHIAA
ncbi:lipopolysaccharide heptosyltransferase II, partial [Candidatus Dependentiae bacterium]|nr:lipopolysaccharide heptosyltransferase II [Candidatus Dependentiae bacterium]